MYTRALTCSPTLLETISNYELRGLRREISNYELRRLRREISKCQTVAVQRRKAEALGPSTVEAVSFAGLKKNA